ncbi:hypothetical protein AB0C21_42715 [Spirillospora sp. NPDC049024]
MGEVIGRVDSEHSDAAGRGPDAVAIADDDRLRGELGRSLTVAELGQPSENLERPHNDRPSDPACGDFAAVQTVADAGCMDRRSFLTLVGTSITSPTHEWLIPHPTQARPGNRNRRSCAGRRRLRTPSPPGSVTWTTSSAEAYYCSSFTNICDHLRPHRLLRVQGPAKAGADVLGERGVRDQRDTEPVEPGGADRDR